MTFEKTFVKQKLDRIIDYLAETEDLFKLSDKEIKKDFTKFHTAERLLQLIVDEIIDINQHFIKELDLKTPEDFQSTFYILGENKILPLEFAQKIAPVVGMRNRIVHRYEKLDKNLFIEKFRKNISDFKTYLKIINDFTETKN
ncbi:MAG: DUF86 domain-containing protein [Xanthomonadaceae bacterium]|nr:DUF86 domain-containing protein [Rhodospirillaceae bacterium]NIA17633.1 DUF86 domain-containing protein [Xanthomonadaceae bacterium]